MFIIHINYFTGEIILYYNACNVYIVSLMDIYYLVCKTILYCNTLLFEM